MNYVQTLDDLSTLYGSPAQTALTKVTQRLTPSYCSFILRSRFCVLTTVGPSGTDGTPRGDEGPVVKVLDETTLALPDWHGNNRIDSLTNIVLDGRVSLLFLIAGCNNAVRVNGMAKLTADEPLRKDFEHQGKLPRSVIIIKIAEVYSQCARALIRSALWTAGDQSAGLPSAGDMIKEASSGAFGGPAYDADWAERASKTLW